MIEKQLLGYKIRINGIVQGVGFRPHVFRLATELGLDGWVLNSSYGVFIEIEGPKSLLDQFIDRVINAPPPLARIQSYEVEQAEPSGYDGFIIKKSEPDQGREVMVSPDIAICDECKKEVQDAQDRRYLYPFTNCTNCGPRFTIIKDLPYDRGNTTMASFSMCGPCQQEYENPLHRRFHAQPNACPACGPQVSLRDRWGNRVEESALDLLKQGFILAVKGLGGFNLAVDARNGDAVVALRQRKRRDAKPFAVMVRDLDTAHKYCQINAQEENYLVSPQAPIVVLEAKSDNGLPGDAIYPNLTTLGVMLPYTPLHFLLFDQELDILVMTSANISDEPLIVDNQEAMEKLDNVADYFLIHNREIYNPCDDSVITVSDQGTPHFYRRARGYVPGAIHLSTSSSPVLAVGSELKNTFCVTRGAEAYISQHWGDLNHYHNYVNFLNAIERFKSMLAVEPAVIAHDLHPEYQATRWAKSQTGVRLIGVQHHHAHLASVMAENGLDGEVLGLICDGTGWGVDGTIWGGEILQGGYENYTRVGHLKKLPLIGGDLSSRRPYRMALMYLIAAMGEEAIQQIPNILPDLPAIEGDFILQRFHNQSEIQTSSCGRLFDAVGALLGIRSVNHYEGQAAIELEAIADRRSNGIYPYAVEIGNDMLVMNILRAWPQMVSDLKDGLPVANIARKFHSTVSAMFLQAIIIMRERTGLNRIVLSGGVFHNQVLLYELISGLQKNEFEVYQHQQVPPGDGGISLGQAVIASWR